MCRILWNCKSGYQRACKCIYTLHCLGGKPNEMKASEDINQDSNHLRLLSETFLLFLKLTSINYMHDTEFY